MYLLMYLLSGTRVDMAHFFSYATGFDSGLKHVCGVVQNYHREIGFAARSCSERKFYLCKYGKRIG